MIESTLLAFLVISAAIAALGACVTIYNKICQILDDAEEHRRYNEMLDQDEEEEEMDEQLKDLEIEFSVGDDKIIFTIVTNMPETGIGVGADMALDSWLPRTDTYTCQSFVDYINSKSYMSSHYAMSPEMAIEYIDCCLSGGLGGDGDSFEEYIRGYYEDNDNSWL